MKPSSAPTAASKRLCEIFYAGFIMFRKGLAKRNFFSHLRLCETFSCRFMDPDAAIAAPREVQFYAAARRRRQRRGVARVARAFEILDSVLDDGGVVEGIATPLLSVLATPSTSVRKLRVTDSPFPLEEPAGEVVDVEAEEFIQRFYEQLRAEFS